MRNSLAIIERIISELKTVMGFVIMTDQELSMVSTSLQPTYSYEALLEEALSDYTWPMIDEHSAYSACYTTGIRDRTMGPKTQFDKKVLRQTYWDFLTAI